MKTMRCRTSLLVGAGALLALAARGAPPTEEDAKGRLGAELYVTHCADCHGDGSGNGPRASLLAYEPADLTGLARRNGGRFPWARSRRVVDGREKVRGPGSEMPIFGDELRTPEHHFEEARVQRELDAIVFYLTSLQDDDD